MGLSSAGQPGAPLAVLPAEGRVPEPDLRDYFWALWRRKWVVALVTLLVVGAALAFSYLQKAKYTAKADILLQPTNSATLGAQGGSLDATEVATQIQIVTSAPVKGAVAAAIHGTPPDIKVTQVGQTNVIEISATAGSGRRAAAVANAYAKAYVGFRQQQAVNSLLSAAGVIQSRVNSLDHQITSLGAPNPFNQSQLTALNNEVASYQAQLNQLQVNAQLATGSAQIVTPASTPSSPSSPRPKRTGALAVGVGLLLGCGLALLLEALDESIKTKADLEMVAAGLPVLGVVPRWGTAKEHKQAMAVTLAHPMSHAAEAYRQLRTSLQFVNLGENRQAVLVTSPSAAEGKTTTAVNLAVALAQSEKQVVLVDADLRRPRIHEYFGLDREFGLTTVLLGEARLQDALQRLDNLPNLRVLPSGPIPPNPAEVLANPKMADLLENLREADAVIVDSPPTLPVADAQAIASRVDAVLLVTQAGVTTTKAVVRALELLAQVGAPMGGLLINAVPDNRRGWYNYYYGPYYGYRYRNGQRSDDRSITGGPGDLKLLRAP